MTYFSWSIKENWKTRNAGKSRFSLCLRSLALRKFVLIVCMLCLFFAMWSKILKEQKKKLIYRCCLMYLVSTCILDPQLQLWQAGIFWSLFVHFTWHYGWSCSSTSLLTQELSWVLGYWMEHPLDFWILAWVSIRLVFTR